MAALAISETTDGGRVLALSGRLDATTVRPLWDEGRRAVTAARGAQVVVDAAKVDYCDGAGIAMLVGLMQQGGTDRVQVANLAPAFAALLAQFDVARLARDLDPPPRRRPAIAEVGVVAAKTWADLKRLIAFTGETTAALAWVARRPGRVRWKDVWVICERTGVDALPIVALIAFLLGIILAFQSAVPMRRFGAELFVADLIGIAMVRELGALMTAILLAGRSGAAFAAELGTMTVNQEVDALTTMGLDPVRFLVAPRIIAALLMTPILTLFAMFVGLLGGAITMHAFSIPFVTYIREVNGILDLGDFLAGFVKSFVFAILIAGIGCLRGLQARAGASSVGDSATSAVVSGIILLVIVDGIFAVVYFLLDI